MHLKQRTHSAFTLIELLIVVAIIAILAAIAVPNFLEAQTRAKISRAKADMRTMVTAMETYHIDNNAYLDAITNSDLIDHGNSGGFPAPAYSALRILSTPVSYMSSIPSEAPFKAYSGYETNGVKEKGYQYQGGKTQWESGLRSNIIFYPASYKAVNYLFNTVGPSKIYSVKATENTFTRPRTFPYNPTNGTVSQGDIMCPVGNHGGWTSMD